MKELRHKLADKQSDKLLNLTLNGTKLISETGKAGKLKAAEKEFATAEEASKNFYKKEWEALKKGFTLLDGEAQPGAPILHKYIGGGYTGALSFQGTPDGIYIYRNAGQGDTLNDELVLIDPEGTILKSVALPKPLAWNIVFNKPSSLLLDIDHHIYALDIATEVFTDVSKSAPHVTSFVSVAGDKIAFATAGTITVRNLQHQVLWSGPYDTAIVSGSTPFCGKLSADGKLLAFHNQVGRIQIIDATNGKLLNSITASFDMAEQMDFANDNSLLVVKEQYGTWGMRYFEIPDGREIELPGLAIPEYMKDVNTACFNEDQSKLVLIQRSRAHVFDFRAQKLMHSFHVDHVVKKCKAKFIGDQLGVRTDYGCFSLYCV